MADGVMNRAKGRVTEWAERVNSNDPANSALVVVILKSSGLESDATLRDYDDLASILAATNDEATNSGYARRTLNDSGGITILYDDTNDRVDVDIPDQTWTAVAATGGGWGKLLVGYDSDTTTGSDSNVLPATNHDFVVTPDGSDIVAVINAAGFYRAS